MKKVCVFCGSSKGNKPDYVDFAKKCGKMIVEKEYGLVYGGASIGVMGALADAAIEAHGKVWGIMPQSIVDLEVAHTGLTHMQVVNSMHQRKERMYELSDIFVIIPGGMGTMDEFFEIFTWAQLEFHTKKIYLVNLNGFFDNLIAHIKHAVDEGFVSAADLELFEVVNSYNHLESKL